MDKSNTSEQKRLFVVLGMHRCGTSAITRGLQVMDVHLGDKLMPQDEGNNDKGFWEDIEINALNVEMLNALNNDWHHLSLIKQDDLEILKRDGFFQRASELIHQKTLNYPVFGFKDPRTAKLFPFWKDVFNGNNYDVNYILAVRHPLSVALSLAKRNGIDMEKSHLLWLIHIVKCLSGLKNCNYIVVDYDNLIQCAEHELKRITEKFHLHINQTELDIYNSTFLDQNLRHTVFRFDDLMQHDRTSDFLRDVYSSVIKLSVDNQMDSDELHRKTKIWEAELEKMNLSFIMADKAFKHIDVVHQQLNEKELLILKEKEEKEEGIKKLNESLEKSRQQTAQIELLNIQQAEKTNIIVEKEKIITEKEKIISENKSVITEKSFIIADQEDRITMKEHIIAEKELIILQEKEEKNSLLRSRSWQITKPLRYVAKLLRKFKS